MKVVISKTYKKNSFFATLFFFVIIKISAQEIKIRNNVDTDSFFEASKNFYSLEKLKKLNLDSLYYKCGEKEKEFILYILSSPKSSKSELITNYYKNENEILAVKTEFKKLVPDSHKIFIEFEPANKVFTIESSIKITIEKKILDDSSLIQNNKYEITTIWKPDSNSVELNKILSTIGWSINTLITVKDLLDKINCISIDNENETTIGFARSGLGKYSYKIFDNNNSKNKKKELKQKYNDGCQYIYLKDNVVIQYNGGAFGIQCFENNKSLIIRPFSILIK
jgi:hypothetical protein